MPMEKTAISTLLVFSLGIIEKRANVNKNHILFHHGAYIAAIVNQKFMFFLSLSSLSTCARCSTLYSNNRFLFNQKACSIRIEFSVETA